MAKEVLGLFGGTFAPPHNGHVYALGKFLEAVKPDRTVVMPTGIPPHKYKAAGDTPGIRLEMCREAFGAFPGTEVSDYEILRAGKSYTYLTLEHLYAPGREIVMLCGSDMFLTLSGWYRAPEIFRLATVAALTREPALDARMRETAARYEGDWGARVILIGAEPLKLSSTEVRRRIREGGSLCGLLPEGVERIVRREHLYESDDADGEKA